TDGAFPGARGDPLRPGSHLEARRAAPGHLGSTAGRTSAPVGQTACGTPEPHVRRRRRLVDATAEEMLVAHLDDPDAAPRVEALPDDVGPAPRYSRVLVKLSGEVFGAGRLGVDPDVVSRLAGQLATAVREGVQVAVVVGGGNFFRGAELSQRGMDRARADYMGMLGTVMNCLALQDFLEQRGIQTRVQTAITMGQVAEPYVPRRAIRHLEKGRVV